MAPGDPGKTRICVLLHATGLDRLTPYNHSRKHVRSAVWWAAYCTRHPASSGFEAWPVHQNPSSRQLHRPDLGVHRWCYLELRHDVSVSLAFKTPMVQTVHHLSGYLSLMLNVPLSCPSRVPVFGPDRTRRVTTLM